MVAGRRDSMACRQVGELGSAVDGNAQNLDFSSKVILYSLFAIEISAISQKPLLCMRKR